MYFSTNLKNIRLTNGYKTAKAFYRYLENQVMLSFNYPYYTRMEAGAVLPSYDVVNQMAKLIKKEDAELLIQGYCLDMFPGHLNIFKSIKSNSHNEEQLNKPYPYTFNKQQELSLLQVDVIAKSKQHYQMFLLLTLSRNNFFKNQ